MVEDAGAGIARVRLTELEGRVFEGFVENGIVLFSSDDPSRCPQPDGRPARPRSALHRPVLAMADRSIDPGLATAHACRRSARRRLV